MKKSIIIAMLCALLIAFCVVPISASVSVSIPEGTLLYNRNNIRSHTYSIQSEAITRPLPNLNYLDVDYGEETHKTVTTTGDNCPYTADVYPYAYYGEDYASVLGLYFYSPTTYYATFNNTFLHTSYSIFALNDYIEQLPYLNGYYVLSNSEPSFHYYGEVYVVTADNERHIVNLEDITPYIIPIYSPWQSMGSLENQSWIWEITSSTQGGADAMLQYTYLEEPTSTATCYYIPSLTEAVNLYFRQNYEHLAYVDGDKTKTMYTKNCSLSITTDMSLYIVSQYTSYQAPQNQSFVEYPHKYSATDFQRGVFENLDVELAYGLSITEMAYIVVSVVALGYVLKLIGGG